MYIYLYQVTVSKHLFGQTAKRYRCYKFVDDFHASDQDQPGFLVIIINFLIMILCRDQVSCHTSLTCICIAIDIHHLDTQSLLTPIKQDRVHHIKRISGALLRWRHKNHRYRHAFDYGVSHDI